MKCPVILEALHAVTAQPAPSKRVAAGWSYPASQRLVLDSVRANRKWAIHRSTGLPIGHGCSTRDRISQTICEAYDAAHRSRRRSALRERCRPSSCAPIVHSYVRLPAEDSGRPPSPSPHPVDWCRSPCRQKWPRPRPTHMGGPDAVIRAGNYRATSPSKPDIERAVQINTISSAANHPLSIAKARTVPGSSVYATTAGLRVARLQVTYMRRRVRSNDVSFPPTRFSTSALLTGSTPKSLSQLNMKPRASESLITTITRANSSPATPRWVANWEAPPTYAP